MHINGGGRCIDTQIECIRNILDKQVTALVDRKVLESIEVPLGRPLEREQSVDIKVVGIHFQKGKAHHFQSDARGDDQVSRPGFELAVGVRISDTGRSAHHLDALGRREGKHGAGIRGYVEGVFQEDKRGIVNDNLLASIEVGVNVLIKQVGPAGWWRGSIGTAAFNVDLGEGR